MAVWLGLVQAEAPCPRLSRLRFYDLLAGWKLDCFLLIRVNGRLAPKAALGSIELEPPLYPRKQTQFGNRGMSKSAIAFGYVGNSAAVFPIQMHGIDVIAVPTTLLSK